MRPVHRRIEGIESNLQIVEKCEQNIKSFNPLFLDNVIFVHHCEAVDYVIPRDITHIFVWNVGVLKGVLAEKISLLLKTSRDEINVVVALPRCETDALKYFNSFDQPTLIETGVWTGINLYWFRRHKA